MRSHIVVVWSSSHPPASALRFSYSGVLIFLTSCLPADSEDAPDCHPRRRAAIVSQRGLASLSYGAHRALQQAPSASVTREASSLSLRSSPHTRMMLKLPILGGEQLPSRNTVSHLCRVRLIAPCSTFLLLQLLGRLALVVSFLPAYLIDAQVAHQRRRAATVSQRRLACPSCGAYHA